jgi:hypothetical protein
MVVSAAVDMLPTLLLTFHLHTFYSPQAAVSAHR